MKKLFIVLLMICFAGFCYPAEKVRQFNSAGKPLAYGQTGVYSLTCTTDAEWSNSGCPDNVKIYNGAVRFKTAEEKQAEILTAQQTAILKETVFSKLEITEVLDEQVIVQAVPATETTPEVKQVTLRDILDQVLKSNPKFEQYWNDADKGIDLTYPKVVEALASFPVTLDIPALKLAILANRQKKASK